MTLFNPNHLVLIRVRTTNRISHAHFHTSLKVWRKTRLVCKSRSQQTLNLGLVQTPDCLSSSTSLVKNVAFPYISASWHKVLFNYVSSPALNEFLKLAYFFQVLYRPLISIRWGGMTQPSSAPLSDSRGLVRTKQWLQTSNLSLAQKHLL